MCLSEARTTRWRSLEGGEDLTERPAADPPFSPLPSPSLTQAGGRPSLRPTIWKIFLRIADIPSDPYLSFVAQGESFVHDKSPTLSSFALLLDMR